MGQNEREPAEKYDVVIVGSGPAGASAARTLTGRDVKTLIVEREQLPRYKMCSGILFPSAIKLISEDFGEIPAGALCKPLRIKGNRVSTTLDSPILEAPFRVFDEGADLPEDGYNARRPELDHWLCSRSDASILDRCTFQTLREHDGELIVGVQHEGRKIEIRTQYLVGADGTRSKVRRVLAPDFEKTLRIIPNYEEWYRGSIDLEAGWLYLFFDRKLTGYFASLFHKDDLIIAVTGEQPNGSVKKTFAEFVGFLEQRHGLVMEERVASYGCSLHDMSATGNFFLGRDRVLLAGEAGGFNRCGEGITSALITGRAAGRSILESLETGTPVADLYARGVAPEMEACKRVNHLIEQVVGVNPFTRD